MKTLLTLTLIGGTMLSTAAYSATVDVPVTSGGTAESGRSQISAVQDQYSNKLVFTGENGMYLAGVNVSITDNKGNEVLNTVTDGPMLLVDLPKGTYKVHASLDGETQTHTIHSGSNLNVTQLRLPIADEQDYDLSESQSPMDNTPEYTVGYQNPNPMDY